MAFYACFASVKKCVCWVEGAGWYYQGERDSGVRVL